MNCWMTEERREIARQYVHDMINSFVEDPHSANYHDEYNPPYVSFYSPDIELLLEKACYKDKYVNAHKELAEFNGLDPDIYDIEGHRVRALNGMIDIDIDGVAFDQLECDRLRRLGETKDTKDTKTNKFLIQLPPK